MKERSSDRIEYLETAPEKASKVFDLSATGVCILHASGKKPGEMMTLSLNSNSFRAKVIYCQERKDGFRIGLQFWQIAGDQKKKLAELVERFSKGVPFSCTTGD